MKKRLLSMMLAAVMVISLAACGTDGGSTTDSTGDASNSSESDIKIGMVTDVGGVNDGSFNQSAWKGLQDAKAEFGITVDYMESATDADYAPNIENFIDEEYDLIICIGYQLADALRNAAEANPDQKFAIVDDSSCSDLPNVASLMFEQSQCSFLVGYIAGLTTKTNVVGFVLGMSTDLMNQFGYGYVAGAISANENITVLQNDVNNFADTAAGKTAANNMVANNADVIYHAAGGSGLGVIDACKEAGIWAIGVDSDQYDVAPDTVLTSAMKRVDTACYNISKAVLNEEYEGGKVITYSLEDEGVDISTSTQNISEDVLEAIEDVKAKIISGEIEVPKTKEAFEKAYGDVYELD